jgi:hypothetical protein
VFNMIEDLFAPGRKHTAEEQKRLELSRVDVDGSDPGRGPIDLTSGKVTIRLPQERDGEDSEAETAGTGAEMAASKAEAAGAGAEAGAAETGAEAEEGTARNEATPAPEAAAEPDA